MLLFAGDLNSRDADREPSPGLLFLVADQSKQPVDGARYDAERRRRVVHTEHRVCLTCVAAANHLPERCTGSSVVNILKV